MKCWHCNNELIWGGDHDMEEEEDEYLMVTNLSCPKKVLVIQLILGSWKRVGVP